MLCALFAVFVTMVRRTVGIFSATGLFGSSAFLMAVGTLVQVDLAIPADSLYADIVTYSTAAYLVASVAFTAPRRERAADLQVRHYRPGPPFWLAIVLCLAVVYFYFRAVGQSAFLSGLGALVRGGSNDVATLRLDAYSGSRYLYPGYVNQFKNALLPALTVVAVLYLWHRPWRSITIPPLVAVTVFALIGTGQRGAFFLSSVTVLTFWAMWSRGRAVSVRALVAVGAVVSGVGVISTLVLARNKALTYESSWSERLTTSLGDLVDRVVLVNQLSGIYGFRYTQSLPRAGFGADWRSSLLGLLPGNRGTDLSRRIFAMRYGSDRGTSPPSLWGSIHYNFGVIGTLLAPIILAWLLAILTSMTLRHHQQNALEAVGIAGVTAIVGMWVADTPLFLFNSGIVMFVLVWWLGRHTHRGDSPPDQPEPPLARSAPARAGASRRLAAATASQGSREALAQSEGRGRGHAHQRQPLGQR